MPTTLIWIATLCLALCTANPASAQRGSDYCAGSPRATLILFDRTTPFDDSERDTARLSIGGVVDGLAPRERLVVATIERHYSVSRQVFDGCMPACRSGDRNCSPLRAEREARSFRGRLSVAVHAMLTPDPAQDHSDITGTIARQARRPYRFTRVILYSDMLENSQALPWATFRDRDNTTLIATVTEYGFVPRLAGAEVHIVGFGRLHDGPRSPLPATLDAKIRRFWDSYFAATGARTPVFE